MKGEDRLGKESGSPCSRSHLVRVSQVSRTGHGSPNVVVVLGTRSPIACVHTARTDLLETSYLRNGLPHAHQSGLRRRVRLRKNRAHNALRKRRAAQRYSSQTAPAVARLTSEFARRLCQLRAIPADATSDRATIFAGVGQSGAVQGGAAFVSGLLRCRRCGRKLTVLYTGKHHVVRYCMSSRIAGQWSASCIAFGGMSVDEAIAK